MATRRPPAYHRSALWKLYDRVAEFVDRKVGWDRLPVPLGLAVIPGIRDVLRARNLYDTSGEPAVNLPPVAPPTPQVRTTRTLDGTYNDLDDPRMGMAGSRFGRNVPVEATYPAPPPDIMQPNPREISRALLTRDKLIPATGANVLVATWVQFMIRDWFSHGTSPTDDPWEVPLADDDPWPGRPMLIMRTPPDPTATPGRHRRPTYANVTTPWWDLSQIYGTTAEFQQWVRSGTPPPDSRVPRITDATLVTPDKLAFPSIPGVRFSRLYNGSGERDFGPRVRGNSGVIDKLYPDVSSTHRLLVPQVDRIGNDLAGVHHPFVAVPVATLTGWNTRTPEFGGDDLCDLLGSTIPLKRTKAEASAAGDPRPVLDELYRGHPDYVRKVEAAARALVQQRLMLEEDVERLVSEADRSDVMH